MPFLPFSVYKICMSNWRCSVKTISIWYLGRAERGFEDHNTRRFYVLEVFQSPNAKLHLGIALGAPTSRSCPQCHHDAELDCPEQNTKLVKVNGDLRHAPAPVETITIFFVDLPLG